MKLHLYEYDSKDLNMGFREWIKVKKKRREAERKAKGQDERALNLDNSDSGFVVDPSAINPPETRFTEDYKEFIEKQEGVDGETAIVVDDAYEDVLERVKVACEKCAPSEAYSTKA